MNSEDILQPVAKQYAEFITVTCLEWHPILADDKVKSIITQSLSFLTQANRTRVYAFVIMSNHFHLIWQALGDHHREDVQRDFLKYTSQQILRFLEEQKSELLDSLRVNSKDRKYQLWQRNSLGIPLWSGSVVWQKLSYIHENPVRAGLSKKAEDYVYSSAAFYLRGDKHWSFLTHCDG